VAIVPMIRRRRRRLVVIVMMIIPLILLRSLLLDYGGMAPVQDQSSRADQK
jgi:hypothetical protein